MITEWTEKDEQDCVMNNCLSVMTHEQWEHNLTQIFESFHSIWKFSEELCPAEREYSIRPLILLINYIIFACHAVLRWRFTSVFLIHQFNRKIRLKKELKPM